MIGLDPRTGEPNGFTTGGFTTGPAAAPRPLVWRLPYLQRKGASQSLNVLLMEPEEPATAEVEDALRALGFTGTLLVVPDEAETLALLHRRGFYQGSVLPDLVLLSATRSPEAAFRLLGHLRADTFLRTLPCFLLAAREKALLEQGFCLGADAVLPPLSDDPRTFQEVCRRVLFAPEDAHASAGPQLTLLAAEDDPDDRVLIEEALAGLPLALRLRTAADGEEAVHALSVEEKDLPDIILLDMRMPKLSGLEVLQSWQRHPWIETIPILFFATSPHEAVLARSHCRGPFAYITKPWGYDEFLGVVRHALFYWGCAAAGR